MAYTTSQLTTFFTNSNAGTGPSAAQTLTLTALANQNAAGTLTDAQALAQTIDLASDATTAVSVQTYAFFTGVAPSQAGLTYLNQAFVGTGAQAGLNGENRFIAQSVALALQNTAAKTAFSGSYGALTVAEATKAAYNIIVGNAAATAAGINIDNAVAFLSSTASVTYYTNFVKANVPGLATGSAADIDLAVKAAIVGEIMYAATTFNNGAGVGSYATATTNLIKDLADDGKLVADSSTGINLFTNYGSGGTGSGGTPGSTLALTTATDAITGTANDDTINAVITGTTAAPGNTTLTFGDTINGGAGNDTLVVLSNATAGVTLSGLQLTSIENINVNNTSAAGADLVTVDLSGVTGVNSVVSTGQGDVKVSNIGTGTAVGFKDVTIATGNTADVTASGARTVSISGVSTAGTGVANVDVSAATAAGVGDTLNIVNTGKAASITTLTYGATAAATTKTVSVNAGGNITIKTLTSASANELTTLKVTGAGAFKITDAIASNALKTVDATSNTGGVTLSVDATALTSLKTGTGKDTITVANGLGATSVVDLGAGNDKLTLAAAITAGATINGGDGTDTLAISAAAVLNSDLKAAISGFETIDLSGAAQTYDVTNLTGFTNVNVSGGTVTLDKVGANATFNVTGSPTTLTTVLASTSGTADTVNLNIGVAGTNLGNAGTFKAVGVENLNINSIDGTTASDAAPVTNALKIDAADTSLTKVVVTGNGQFSLDATAASHALSVDASAATAGFTLNAAAVAQTINVIGTAVNDTITTGASGGLINAGKGGDAITLGAGADTVILKGGDSVLDVTNAAGVGNKGTMDTIASFATGADKLDLTQIGGFGSTGQGVTTGVAADTDALKTLLATANVFKDGGGLQRGVLQVVVGGADSYVAVDVNHDGQFTAATDLIVKLTGITATLATTDIVFGS